jgi:hypothetical protein
MREPQTWLRVGRREWFAWWDWWPWFATWKEG